MNQLSIFLNHLFSGLKGIRSKPVRPFYGFVAAAIVLTTLTLYIQDSPLIRDWEQRFQSNFYLFGSFFKTPEAGKSPLVVLLINDQSLPEKAVRSPIDRRWLRALVEKVADHEPALIGLNILLDRPQNAIDDQALANSIAENGKTIIRSDPYYLPLPRFSNAALAHGTLRFRFDSSGAVQEICHSPSTCRSQKIFHLSLLQHLENAVPGASAALAEMQPAWLRIDFSASYQLSAGKKFVQFPVIFANELKSLPLGVLKDKIVLIGAGFPDLYPLLRTPLSQDEHFLQETEILARALDMIIGNRYLKPVPTIYSVLLLLGMLLVLARLLSTRGILPGFWFLLVSLPALFFLAAFAFVMFRQMIPYVLPASTLILFFCVGTVQQVLQERFSRLMTELRLKEAKIDFLTNELHTHHLFNELSRLNVMIGQHPATARAYLVEFAELLRASLKYGDQPRVAVSVQMDYLTTYTNQQSIIYKDKVRFTFDVKGNWESIHAPWHVFFPLLENAVKHTEAILRREPEQPLLIEITLREENHRLHFTVKNPFMSDCSSLSTGKGLFNLNERLKWSYPRGGFELSSLQHDRSWVATLRLPLS